MIMFLVLFVTGSVELCSGADVAKKPDWIEHMPTLLPLLQLLMWSSLKLFIWVTGSLMSIIGMLLWWIGKRWMAKRQKDQMIIMANQEIILGKINVLHDIMMECDGCSSAASALAKKTQNMEIIDAENTH